MFFIGSLRFSTAIISIVASEPDKIANKYPDGFPINGITKIPPCGT